MGLAHNLLKREKVCFLAKQSQPRYRAVQDVVYMTTWSIA